MEEFVCFRTSTCTFQTDSNTRYDRRYNDSEIFGYRASLRPTLIRAVRIITASRRCC